MIMKSNNRNHSGKRKKIGRCSVFFFCFIIVVYNLTGCKTETVEEPIEITLMHGWGGTMKTHALMQELYQKFDEENEDIVINFQPSSDNTIAVEKANDLLSVDKMPDVVSTNGQSYYVSNAVKKKMALDLMPYIEKDPVFQEEIDPKILESWRDSAGCVYTLPDAWEIKGYWYNAAYFKEAGIVDENGEVKLPVTWTEFYDACDKLQAWNEKSNQLISVYALENVQVVESLFLARLAGENEQGLEMTQEAPKQFDNETFRRVVREFAKIWDYSKDTNSLDYARQYIMEGKTAMYFNGVWECEIFKDSDNKQDIAYANYPTRDGKSLSYVSSSSGYVVYDNPDERKVEAGIRFLKYMLSEEVQTKLALETGQAPSNPHVDINIVQKEYPLLGNALSMAHSADIQIKSITAVWDSQLIEVLSKELREASQNEERLDILIQKLENVNKTSESQG